jgi:hypothetical protein
MKHLTLAILTITALAFGACARHDNAPASSSYSSTSTTGYSK